MTLKKILSGKKRVWAAVREPVYCTVSTPGMWFCRHRYRGGYNYDSTATRSPFTSHSTAIRSRYDRSTTNVTTGLLQRGLNKQEAQLMLTNPRDTMFYVNRVSAYLVPFSR